MKALYQKYKEQILYIFFGGLTTVVNFIIFFAFTWLPIFSFLPEGYRLLPANVIAWIGAVLFAYITNERYVFVAPERTKASKLAEFFYFVLARFLSLVLETGLLYVTIHVVLIHSTDIPMRIKELIAKIIGAVFVIIFNYIASKFFIFKK